MNIPFKSLLSGGDQRLRQAVKTSFVSVLSQVVQIATAVVSVPIVLNSLGAERYGLWMTLSTVLLFVTFSDFGMGIGMQNQMSYARAGDDTERLRKIFSTTLAFGLVIFVGFLVSTYFVLPQLDFSKHFEYEDETIASEILPTVQIVSIVLAFGMLSGLVQRAFDAYQEGYYPKWILLLARFISLILLFYAAEVGAGITTFILIVSGVPNLLLFFGILLLYKIHPYLLFRLRDIDFNIFRQVLKVGIAGLGASISIFLVTSITPFIISKSYGLAESARYLVLMRLLNFVILFFSMMFMSFWPAVADAYSRKDVDWLTRLYRKGASLLLKIGIPLFIMLAIASRFIIEAWTGDPTITPSYSLTIVACVYTSLAVWNMITCVFLNGMSLFKGQALYGSILGIIFLSLAYVLRERLDPTGIVAVITVGFFIRCVILHIELRQGLDRLMEDDWERLKEPQAVMK